jgi:hypothetical protein
MFADDSAFEIGPFWQRKVERSACLIPYVAFLHQEMPAQGLPLWFQRDC